jgi:NAD(P)-dependent dehydrogenase (short-subunit alcohol dehydrogenase family)
MPDVVITGASSGIGFAACEALIRRGFRVFGSVRTKADADRLTEQLGRQYVPLIFDVTDPDSVNQVAAAVKKW